MSSRARRTPRDRATTFVWSESLDLPAAATARVPVSRPDTIGPASAPEPADHESRLAAIERDAFAKGYAQGEQAGVEAGTRRAEAMLRRLGATLEELGSLRAEIIRQSERQLVQLALAIARRIVRREVTIDEEFLTAMARVALDRLGESGRATIHLHPDDYARTAVRLPAQLSSTVQVVADGDVSRGGCLVESPFGFVDASVDAQFQELARALLDGDMAQMQDGGGDA